MRWLGVVLLWFAASSVVQADFVRAEVLSRHQAGRVVFERQLPGDDTYIRLFLERRRGGHSQGGTALYVQVVSRCGEERVVYSFYLGRTDRVQHVHFDATGKISLEVYREHERRAQGRSFYGRRGVNSSVSGGGGGVSMVLFVDLRNALQSLPASGCAERNEVADAEVVER